MNEAHLVVRDAVQAGHGVARLAGPHVSLRGALPLQHPGVQKQATGRGDQHGRALRGGKGRDGEAQGERWRKEGVTRREGVSRASSLVMVRDVNEYLSYTARGSHEW